MKFTSQIKGGLSLVQIMVVIAIIGLLAAITLPKCAAQSYYTNTTPANGAFLPNASVIPAPQPVAVRNAQYALGINTGTVAIGAITNANAMVVPFATNYVYSVAPVVTLNSSITNYPAAVTATTTTNFTFAVLATNGVAVNWSAIGR